MHPKGRWQAGVGTCWQDIVLTSLYFYHQVICDANNREHYARAHFQNWSKRYLDVASSPTFITLFLEIIDFYKQVSSHL